MAVDALISVEEYLNTSYEPDMEYVDGELVERNIGERQHSQLHGNIIFALCRKYRSVQILPSVTTKVTESRYRIPDGRFVTEAPFVVIEILSEEDHANSLQVIEGNTIATGEPRIELTRDEVFQD
jgi:Uma2 family endonuclease